MTQGLDTDIQNPASRFLLHVLGAAAEFERSLIRERTQAGRLRYQQDYNAGKVGKTVYSRSGKNLPVGRPKRTFNRERVIELRWKEHYVNREEFKQVLSFGARHARSRGLTPAHVAPAIAKARE